MARHRFMFIAAGLMAFPCVSRAIPVLTTIDCDSTGLFSCLTRIEGFEFGIELYDVEFALGNIVSAYGLDPADESTLRKLDLLSVLGVDGVNAFAAGIANLLLENDIDGFVCAGSGTPCAPPDLPFGWTNIPIGYTIRGPGLFDVSVCIAGRSPDDGGFHFCPYDPGSSSQNWAVVTRIPEPSSIALLVFGLVALRLARRHTFQGPAA